MAQWVEFLPSMHEAPSSILSTKITIIMTKIQGSWKGDPIHSLEELPNSQQSCWAGAQDGDLINHSCSRIVKGFSPDFVTS